MLYVVSSRQLVVSAGLLILTVVSVVWLMVAVLAWTDLPDVVVDQTNHCVKVLNYRNGDGYTCQDKDVILRKYNTVRVVVTDK